MHIITSKKQNIFTLVLKIHLKFQNFLFCVQGNSVFVSSEISSFNLFYYRVSCTSLLPFLKQPYALFFVLFFCIIITITTNIIAIIYCCPLYCCCWHLLYSTLFYFVLLFYPIILCSFLLLYFILLHSTILYCVLLCSIL